MPDQIPSENSTVPATPILSRSSTRTKMEFNHPSESKDERERENKIDGTGSHPPPPSEIDFPEGGLRAWLVVLGVSLSKRTSELIRANCTPSSIFTRAV